MNYATGLFILIPFIIRITSYNVCYTKLLRSSFLERGILALKFPETSSGYILSANSFSLVRSIPSLPRNSRLSYLTLIRRASAMRDLFPAAAPIQRISWLPHTKITCGLNSFWERILSILSGSSPLSKTSPRTMSCPSITCLTIFRITSYNVCYTKLLRCLKILY